MDDVVSLGDAVEVLVLAQQLIGRETGEPQHILGRLAGDPRACESDRSRNDAGVLQGGRSSLPAIVLLGSGGMVGSALLIGALGNWFLFERSSGKHRSYDCLLCDEGISLPVADQTAGVACLGRQDLRGRMRNQKLEFEGLAGLIENLESLGFVRYVYQLA